MAVRSPDNKRIEDFSAISECRADGEQPIDVWSVEPTRRLTWGNRKQAHSNPSWFKRDDAAVLQGVDELGQVREQRSEISIRGYEDSTLDGSEIASSSACCNSLERTWIAS